MKTVRILILSSLLLGVTITSAFSETTDNTGKEKIIEAEAKKKITDMQILFFINPNGRPCQTQLSILDGMKSKLHNIATVKHISTMEPSDRSLFYKYGIRGLPSLIIVDNSEKELWRFTPGIQNEKTILSAFASLSKRNIER